MAMQTGPNPCDPSNTRAQHSVNKWGARIIPAILICAVGYSVWAIVVLLAINHLIRAPDSTSSRKGAGIAIIVVYFLVAIPMAVSYLRLLYVVNTNPGLVPSPEFDDTHGSKLGSGMTEKTTSPLNGTQPTPTEQVGYLDRGSVSSGRAGPPAGLEAFYQRDVFECEVDGMPRWCSTCKTWKPDRTHHSREVGRCIWKMDHFCPWAGGIVSETSFKFFVQFCCYGTAFNALCLIVSTYYTVESHHTTHTWDVNWIVCIGLSALFFFFALGMAQNSLQAVFLNTTTVDNLARRTRIYHFAVLIPPSLLQHSFPQSQSVLHTQPHNTQPQTTQSPPPPPLQTPPQTPPQISPQTLTQPPTLYQTITFPLPLPHPTPFSSQPQPPPRTFAILTTPLGSMPYFLPTHLQNLRSVMGNKWYDWFLPIHYSPCHSHIHGSANPDVESLSFREKGGGGGLMYEFGRDFEELVKGAGLVLPGRGEGGEV